MCVCAYVCLYAFLCVFNMFTSSIDTHLLPFKCFAWLWLLMISAWVQTSEARYLGWQKIQGSLWSSSDPAWGHQLWRLQWWALLSSWLQVPPVFFLQSIYSVFLSSSSSSVFPSYISGVHHFWVTFLCMWPFFNPTIKVVTFHLRGWCVLGVLETIQLQWRYRDTPDTQLDLCGQI